MAKYRKATIVRNDEGSWDVFYSDDEFVTKIPTVLFHTTRVVRVSQGDGIEHALKWVRPKQGEIYHLNDNPLYRKYAVIKKSGELVSASQMKARMDLHQQTWDTECPK